jgi:hypothetical protein
MEDCGIPGKLYFDKPQVIDMSAFRKSDIPEKDPVNGSTRLGADEFYFRTTPIRMKSAVKFMGKEPMPDTIEYALPQRPTQEEAAEYIRVNGINGFGEGAIITRRWQENWRFRWHGNWGMIVRVVGNVPWQTSEAWAPFVVQWFERPDVPFEYVWAEDLVLIHTHLSKDLMEGIFEAQGIPRKTTP